MLAMRHIAFFAALLAIPVSLTANAATPPIPRLTVKTTEFAFAAPERIEAGLVDVTLINEGRLPHHAQLARLEQGTTPERLMELLRDDLMAGLAALTFVGGPGLIDPGMRQQVILDLEPGNHVWLSFVPGEDGAPYLAKGMFRPMEVTPASGTGRAQVAIPADGTVVLREFDFELPEDIASGPQVWRVVNEGKELHEIMIIRAKAGPDATTEEVLAHAEAGAPPFDNLGGFQAITPGQTGWLTLDLAPGEYTALCYIPAAETGNPHFGMGMTRDFTVR